MQLLEWLSLMKEVVMCNKNLMLKSPLKVNSFASKTGIFARRARVDQAVGLYYRNKHNILVNLSLGKSYRSVITFLHA